MKNKLYPAQVEKIIMAMVGDWQRWKWLCLEKENNMFELYEFVDCQYCERVRQTLKRLNIEYISRIVGSDEDDANRVKLLELGGRLQVPFLVDLTDPANPVMMYESGDIVKYLEEKFAK